jgi:hypothetical protein
LKVDVDLNGRPSMDVNALLITLQTPDGKTIQTEKCFHNKLAEGRLVKLDSVIAWDQLQDKGVELWWPFTYGKQPLYDLQVSILGEVSILLVHDEFHLI